MMTIAPTSAHYSLETIEKFLAKELNDSESSAFLEHIAHCDICLSLVDERWSSQDLEKLRKQLYTQEVDSVIIAESRAKVLRRIQNAQLGSEAVRLGSNGLWQVLVALVRPFFPTPARKRNRRK